MADEAHPDEAMPESSGWPEHLTWGALLGLGFLIYELTARPSFGIAVACLKFGWPDFYTGWWLLQRDPHRGRGRTCFWFFLAFGLWKVTVTALVVSCCLLILMMILRMKGPEELWHLQATALTGITLGAVVPIIGVGCARRYGVRVWIDGSITAARQHGVWPPPGSDFNALSGLLLPAMVVPLAAAAWLTLQVVGPLYVPLAIFSTGVMIWSQLHGVTAQTSAECWEVEDGR